MNKYPGQYGSAAESPVYQKIAVNPPPTPQKLDQIEAQMSSVLSEIYSLNNRLSNVADRLGGVIPEAAGVSPTSQGANGIVEKLQIITTEMNSAVHAAHRLASRLEDL